MSSFGGSTTRIGRKFCLLISAKVVPVARLSISAMFVWHQFSMKKFEARSLHFIAMKP